jgi:hypothetical protein
VVEGYRKSTDASGREEYALVSRETLPPGDLCLQPDYHTAGWLSPSEFTRVLDTIRSSRREPVPHQWELVEIILSELGRRLGQANVRLVFWFDS